MSTSSPLPFSNLPRLWVDAEFLCQGHQLEGVVGAGSNVTTFPARYAWLRNACTPRNFSLRETQRGRAKALDDCWDLAHTANSMRYRIVKQFDINLFVLA